MKNLKTFKLFEKYQPFQLQPELKKRLDKSVLLGAILSYDVLNADDIDNAILKLTNYRNETVEIKLSYLPNKKFDGPNDLTNYSKLYYRVLAFQGDEWIYGKEGDQRTPNFIEFLNFMEEAEKTYLKSKKVKKIKVGDVEIEKKDIINHVQELDVFKKMMQDFDFENITSPGEAKNGTLTFTYKYNNEVEANGPMSRKPDIGFKITGASGSVYNTTGMPKTIIKYGPLQTLEDYEKALNGLNEYLINFFKRRINKFRKDFKEDPSLQTSKPGHYKMMQRYDNPELFFNPKLTQLIKSGLFDD